MKSYFRSFTLSFSPSLSSRFSFKIYQSAIHDRLSRSDRRLCIIRAVFYANTLLYARRAPYADRARTSNGKLCSATVSRKRGVGGGVLRGGRSYKTLDDKSKKKKNKNNTSVMRLSPTKRTYKSSDRFSDELERKSAPKIAT